MRSRAIRASPPSWGAPGAAGVIPILIETQAYLDAGEVTVFGHRSGIERARDASESGTFDPGLVGKDPRKSGILRRPNLRANQHEHMGARRTHTSDLIPKTGIDRRVVP